ncbi:unnamed protein product, partial [Urochloa humidicola]
LPLPLSLSTLDGSIGEAAAPGGGARLRGRGRWRSSARSAGQRRRPSPSVVGLSPAASAGLVDGGRGEPRQREHERSESGWERSLPRPRGRSGSGRCREAPMVSLASSTPRSGRRGAEKRRVAGVSAFPSLSSGVDGGGGLQLELDAGSRPRAPRPGSWRRRRPAPLALSPLHGGLRGRGRVVVVSRPQAPAAIAANGGPLLSPEVGTGTKYSSGKAFPLGVSQVQGGLNFAIFSQHASSVTLCLTRPERGTQDDVQIVEFALERQKNKTGDILHVSVEGLLASGVLYGYRINGPQGWQQGHRFGSYSSGPLCKISFWSKVLWA